MKTDFLAYILRTRLLLTVSTNEDTANFRIGLFSIDTQNLKALREIFLYGIFSKSYSGKVLLTFDVKCGRLMVFNHTE